MPFACTICAEESTSICARCTQDTCRNHLCEKCLKCSDCCECEVVLEEPVHERAHTEMHAAHPNGQPSAAAPDEEPWEPPAVAETSLPPEDPEADPEEP